MTLLLAGLTSALVGCNPAGGRADLREGAGFEAVIVETARHFPGVDHNIVSLRGTYAKRRPFAADFVGYFDRTGGVERWGVPISEAFEEQPGTLVQYFANGVLDYRPTWGMKWRPVWYLLEKSGDGPIFEETPTNPNHGEIAGLTGQVVSNISVEGTEVGFQNVYERLGGAGTFGSPVTAARSDRHPEARLFVDGPPADVIRQYFQAAVLEDYGDATQAPTFRRLGEDLRAQVYPNGEWMNLVVFLRTAPLDVGRPYPADYLVHFKATAREDSDGDGVVVGRATHPYALAYHPQRHLLYRDGDGWYAFFFNGEHGVLAYSADGVEFNSRQIVTHIPVGKGVSMYEVGGDLYLLYTDASGIKVFLRQAQVSGAEVRTANPILVMEGEVSFSAEIPNMAIGPEGMAWVVVRSYKSTPTGAIVEIWLTRATDGSMGTWTEPVRISSPEEAVRGGAGTSGSLAFAGEDLMVVFGIDGEMVGYVTDSGTMASFVREPAGTFKGTHDFTIIESGGKAHLAYHRAGPSGENMTYRTWTREDSWSERIDLGETTTHTTAMSVDNDGNVWVFYGASRSSEELPGTIMFRILEKGSEVFGPARCAARIPYLRSSGSPWLASAQPSSQMVGLLWVEKPADYWQVKFRTLDLESDSRDAKCAG